jgi:hypothetical protein
MPCSGLAAIPFERAAPQSRPSGSGGVVIPVVVSSFRYIGNRHERWERSDYGGTLAAV